MLMLTRLLPVLSLAACCLLAACDVEHTATYKVTNNTSGTVYVYKTDTLRSKLDTIAAGDTKAVLVESDLSGRVINNAPDKIQGRSVLQDIRKDTEAYKSNPTILSRWAKEDVSKYQVTYRLEVNDADF